MASITATVLLGVSLAALLATHTQPARAQTVEQVARTVGTGATAIGGAVNIVSDGGRLSRFLGRVSRASTVVLFGDAIRRRDYGDAVAAAVSFGVSRVTVPLGTLGGGALGFAGGTAVLPGVGTAVGTLVGAGGGALAGDAIASGIGNAAGALTNFVIDQFRRPRQPVRETRLTSAERALQTSLNGQTTGLASHIGPARPQIPRVIDPAVQQVLALEPRTPFTTTVVNPTTVSTGAFTGTEGLNIAGVLNVLARDSGNLQDGDIVRLIVRDSQGVRLDRTLTLTFAGSTSRVAARPGIATVTITALNLGSAPPNTGGLRVSGDVAGSRSGNFNLQVGQSGTLAVRVLGR